MAKKQAQAVFGKARASSKKAYGLSRKAQAVSEKAQARRNKAEAVSFLEGNLAEEIMREAKVLKIPAKSAESYAKKVAAKVAKWAERREKVTKDDINRVVAKEIAKYSKDLSFVYQNRGKII